MSETARILALLEQGEADATAALDALHEGWADEDAARANHRAFILEAHAQGARDREAVRQRLAPAPAAPVSEAAVGYKPDDPGVDTAKADAAVKVDPPKVAVKAAGVPAKV